MWGYYDGYFHRNRSCRLSPTPPIMKMAVGEIGRGLLSEESLMSVATDTTKHENGSSRGDSRIAPTGAGAYFQRKDSDGVATLTACNENGIFARQGPKTGFRPPPE